MGRRRDRQAGRPGRACRGRRRRRRGRSARPAAGADVARRRDRDDLVGDDPVAERGDQRARPRRGCGSRRRPRRACRPSHGREQRQRSGESSPGAARRPRAAARSRCSTAGPSATDAVAGARARSRTAAPTRASAARASTASATSRGSSWAWRKIRDSPPDCPPPGAPRSYTVTAAPRSASSYAVARPTIPAPMTAMSLTHRMVA